MIRWTFRDALVALGLVILVGVVCAVDRPGRHGHLPDRPPKKVEPSVAVSGQVDAVGSSAAEETPASPVRGTATSADAFTDGESPQDSEESSDNGGDLNDGEPRTTRIIASFQPFASTKPVSRDIPSPRIVVTPASDPTKLIDDHDARPAVPSSPEPKPEPAPVKFFETETRAVSVGYVVDCSSSMSGEPFQAVCLKLAESILALKRDQKFFVIFFNDSFFPMTGSASSKLVKADPSHKRDVIRFLGAAEASGSTNPEPAIQFMTTLAPDVMYLLTDGEFSPLSGSTYDSLRKAGIAVHTLGFETGGDVAMLTEIARRTGGTYQKVHRGSSKASLLFAPESTVRKALSDASPAVRREAVQVALLRELSCATLLIAMLGDSDDDLRDAIRAELRAAAMGSDFGPTDSGDTEAAIRRWTLWHTLRSAGRTRLLSLIAGDDLDALWVAASIARSTGLKAPDEFVSAMRRAPAPAVEELRLALTNHSNGVNHGPGISASPEQIAEAAAQWHKWREEQLAAEAAVKREARVRRAAMLLGLAKNLIGVNDDAVKRRYRDLVENYADTPAGQEAKILLDDSSSAP